MRRREEWINTSLAPMDDSPSPKANAAAARLPARRRTEFGKAAAAAAAAYIEPMRMWIGLIMGWVEMGLGLV